MKKLSELVEQAKFVSDWHGSDWSSALCQDKDGNQAHEIICESRGEAVISTGSNSNEASWLCDYLELCSPDNILAIAEAFRTLEQRSEENQEVIEEYNAAMCESNEAGYAGVTAAQTIHYLMERAEAAEAKLAELAKQKPVCFIHPIMLDYVSDGSRTCGRVWGNPVDEISNEDRLPLFTRPAPAADLAELVPPEADGSNLPFAANGWNACRAEMLRKIEEAK